MYYKNAFDANPFMGGYTSNLNVAYYSQNLSSRILNFLHFIFFIQHFTVNTMPLPFSSVGTAKIASNTSSNVNQGEAISQIVSGRDRALSVDEVLIKKESQLESAKETIKKLNTHIGTTIITSSSSSSAEQLSDNENSDNNIGFEVNQNDASFGKEYNYKTNVRIF